MAALDFSSSVQKIGINPCVDIPERIVQALLRAAGKKRGPIPVQARLNDDVQFRSTVVKYGGKWRLYLNTQMRRESGIAVGDSVQIALSYDPQPRLQPTPRPLKAALERNRRAHISWNKLPPSRRNEILAYLNSLKREDTVERNVSKVIDQLLDGEEAAN